MIDYSKYRSSLKRLEEQNGHRQGNPARSDLDREGIAESVIQRFKTCYDCLWKVLKRHLIEDLGVADPPNSPKPIFRLAHENHVLPSPLRTVAPLRRRRASTHRTTTTAKRRRPVVALAPAFIDDAVRLYQTLSGAPWK